MAFYSPDYFKNPIELNRPISEEEKATHMPQQDRLWDFDETRPHYELSVIRQNSTFVEIVDRNYPVRGIGSLMTIVGMGLTGFMFSWIFFIPDPNDPPPLWVTFGIIGMSAPAFLICLWLFLKESFCYTHYPVRLNRRNRKVYVWRKSGVVSAAWDKVFFFLREFKDNSLTCWDVRGNILAEDGITVVDSFPLSSYQSSVQDDLRRHFEYFRRYMEEGPEQPWRMLEICLPIANRKETWWEGCMRLMLNLHGSPILQLLLFPIFFLPTSLGRFVAMRTSKIPQWPQWVEGECAIDPNDPYLRDSGWEAPREKIDKTKRIRQAPPRY